MQKSTEQKYSQESRDQRKFRDWWHWIKWDIVASQHKGWFRISSTRRLKRNAISTTHSSAEICRIGRRNYYRWPPTNVNAASVGLLQSLTESAECILHLFATLVCFAVITDEQCRCFTCKMQRHARTKNTINSIAVAHCSESVECILHFLPR